MTQGVPFIAEQSFNTIEQAAKCAFNPATVPTIHSLVMKSDIAFHFLCSFAVTDYLNDKEKVWNNKQ